MGLVTAAIVVGAGAMAAGASSSARNARKSRKQQERDMQRQETRMREEMALDNTRDDTGADIELGTEDADGVERRKGRQRRRVASESAAGTPKPPAAVGGLGDIRGLLGGALFGRS